LMEPLVRFFSVRLKLKRWIGALICLTLFLTVFSSIGVILVTTLVRQIASFVESAPYHIAELAGRMEEGNIWLARISAHLPEDIYLPDIQEMMLAIVISLFGGEMAGQGLRALANIPGLFLNMILALLSAFFFMSDRQRIFGTITNACPRWLHTQMKQTQAGLKRAMAGYFRAQAILMIMVGVISLVGLIILGNPYALFLALLFSVLDFIPILGPAIVLLPWALISFILGNMQQGIGLLIMYGVITIARQVLQPKIMGDQMGAHPLASLMAIFIGFRIFGLLGFIVGPSFLMIFIAIRGAKDDA